MGRSQETSNKKDKEKKSALKRKDKEAKRLDRKANAKKGQTLEEMFAYVDEYGNITATPPNPLKKLVVNEEDIELGIPRRSAADEAVEVMRKGTVTFFNDSKGYGFIKDHVNQQSIFVHINSVSFPIQENDQVSFEMGQGQKGPMAINVNKI